MITVGYRTSAADSVEDEGEGPAAGVARARVGCTVLRLRPAVASAEYGRVLYSTVGQGYFMVR